MSLPPTFNVSTIFQELKSLQLHRLTSILTLRGLYTLDAAGEAVMSQRGVQPRTLSYV